MNTMRPWSRVASLANLFTVVIFLCACLVINSGQAFVLRSRRDSPDPSLQLQLSDVHHDIYTGSNREDGDRNRGNTLADKLTQELTKVAETVNTADTAPPAPEPPTVLDVATGLDKNNANNEDGDGHGNNGNVDTPAAVDQSAPEPQQQQPSQQQQEEQQQQQHQEAPPSHEPPPPPDAPEPVAPNEFAPDDNTNLVDPGGDSDSSDEDTPFYKTEEPSIANPEGGAEVIPPEVPETEPPTSPPLVLGNFDPLDPFILPHQPPPPPPPPPSFNSEGFIPFRNALQPPPPPPPPSLGFLAPPPPPPPPPAVHVNYMQQHPRDHPFASSRDLPHNPNAGFINNQLPPLQSPHHVIDIVQLAPAPMKTTPPNESLLDKKAAEISVQIEAQSLARDKYHDLLDLKQDQLANAPKTEAPLIPTPRPRPKPISLAEMKSLAADRAADTLDMHRDLLAAQREKNLAAKEETLRAKERVIAALKPQ